MAVSKQHDQGCLIYELKGNLSAASSSFRICQVFGDNAWNRQELVSEIQVKRSVFFNELSSGKLYVLNDEDLNGAIG